MIDTSVERSAICAPSAAFILGQVTSDLNAFNKLESSDIVRSLFGAEATSPNAMDITEALVTTIDPKDQIKIRSLLQDRGISGVIWRFTSTKKFMVELSKVLDKHGNFLSLSLIALDGNDGISTSVRELVRFNKDRTEFLDKRIRSVECNALMADTLVALHEEAVKALEEKYLKPESPEAPIEAPAPDPIPPPPPKDICHFDITGLESYGEKENELCAQIWDPVGKLVESGMTLDTDILSWLDSNSPLCVPGKKATYTVKREDDDSTHGLYTIHVDLQEYVEEPATELPPAQEKVYHLSDFQSYDIYFNKFPSWDAYRNAKQAFLDLTENTIVRVEGVYHILVQNVFHPLTDDQDVQVLDEKFRLHDEEMLKKGLDVDGDKELNLVPDSNMNPDTLPPPDPDDYQDEMIAIKKFSIVDFTVIDPDRIAVHLTGEDGPALTEFADADFKQFILPGASYTALCDITNGMLREKIASEIFELFEQVKPVEPPKEEAKPEEPQKEFTFNINVNGDEEQELVDQVRSYIAASIKRVADGGAGFALKAEIEEKFHTTVANVDVQKPDEFTTNIVVTLKHIEEPKKETKMPTWKIEIAPALEDIKESVSQALTEIIIAGGSIEEMTDKLRAATEMDNLCLSYDATTETYSVGEEVAATEVPPADIHDPEVQQGLLRGIFGVVDPAITHVQTFLRRHLKEIGNPGYLATETFPTEVMQVWNERPYNFTLSIVKFKDGRFYRIFLAYTNLGLTDQSWLATKDMPDRWVQVGRDISESTFRPNFQNRRR